MKRYGNLFNKICNIENLYSAYHKAKKGKDKSWGVQFFEKDLENNITQLHRELITGKYQTSEYRTFTIYDPKERLISCLPFRDRVVHHAIMNILESIWTSIFITHTYSCIKGRGIHGTVKHLKRDLKDMDGTKYCLKMDIRKFYPSIDHKILKQIIRKKIKDTQLLILLDGIIDSSPGIPIGNYLSQFFANLYLSYFDHWIKESKQVVYYYRYADDIVILANSKQYLHSLLLDIKIYLINELNLHLKSNYQVFPVDSRGIDFVGYVFRHGNIRMRKRIKKNFCQLAAKLNKKDISIKDYKQRLCSHLGWAKHCNANKLLNKIIKYEEIL